MDPNQLGPQLPGMQCLGLIGSGGYADVFLYEQEGLKLRVAVKLMKESVLDDAKRRQFAAEADAMAQLAEHPYIVPVLGAGTAGDGRPYLMMRYYPSADLANRVAAEPMSVPDALRYGVQLSSAVETAHRAGIIHRDIKPANILLSSYGQPGLSDFGIAGRPNDASEDDAGVGVSVPWSPPEMLTGASNGSTTSDVYSLAATVWNLLVGRAPFHLPGGDNGRRATYSRILHSKPPITGRDDVPASLDRLLQQALAKDADHRPQSALELAHHFQRIEQELRLRRTEIVVHDQGDAASTARANAASAQAAPTLAPTRPDPGNALDVTVTGGTPVLPEEELTERKAPVRVESAQSAPTVPEPRLSRSGPQHFSELRTERKAPVAQPTPQLSNTDAPRRRGRTPLLASLGVLAAAAVVVVLITTRGHGGGSSNTPQGQNVGDVPSQATQNDLSNVAPPAAPPAPTSVKGRVHGSKAVFTWPAVKGASSYLWRVEGGTQGITATPSVSVAKAASGQTCITVQSLASGSGATPLPGKHSCVG